MILQRQIASMQSQRWRFYQTVDDVLCPDIQCADQKSTAHSDQEHDEPARPDTKITELDYEDVDNFIVMATGDAKSGHQAVRLRDTLVQRELERIDLYAGE